MENVFFNVLSCKISLVWLNAEMFVQSLLILTKESPDLFDSGKFYERLLILQLVAVLGVVTHQELRQENAWVKSLFNAIVNFSLFRVNKSIDLP